MSASNLAKPMADMAAPGTNQQYPVMQYRQDFPILKERIHGHALTYLDNAASTLKPRQVIASMTSFLETDYANIHRGVHELSVRATVKHDAAREKVQRFINAKRREEIVFVRNGTEAINLVTASWGRKFLKADDEIVITTLEHHSNIVPWQVLRDEIGIKLRVVPLSAEEDIRLADVKAALSPKTKLVAVAHVSNVLGTVLPIEGIIDLAHQHGALALIDGCQAVARMPVDVQQLNADFYVFSSHKLYGPSGVGVLYGKQELLDSMPPYQTGGGMIASVTFDETTYREAPYRFEAGTPAITEAVGFGAAIDYLSSIGVDRIAKHEDDLMHYATEKLSRVNSLQILGSSANRAGVISFVMRGAHPHDIGTILDRHGVAIRAGHHCAQPLMDVLGVPATARASFGLYNMREEVDVLAEALHKVREIFS